METELKCKDKVKAEFTKEIATMRDLWTGYTSGDEDKAQEFSEYGLSFDYVAPHTFNDQRRGYWRYQISWGGPSDEFRFYVDRKGRGYTIDRIEYWFMDWFDGASVTMKSGANFDLMAEIFNFFEECGSVEAEYNKAMADLEVA